jgi:hypothetical protein
MTVNTTTILDPVFTPSMRDEVLAERARAVCRTRRDLPVFIDACEADLLTRFATPEGATADERFHDGALDLMAVLESWRDDLAGTWADLLAFAEAA